ncbi:hypothetical protein SH2C18_41790 [Clostridium sediminicola]|uniref:TetR/AcrR family transcriptional regulator n=1 Tax=Clostridium sediminicola TaxID=3114879 RepID=UPI0031F1DF57
MKKNTVKENILDAALDVVSENTISGTRMHLIAEKAGVAQSNLHYHFKTKKDLMLEMYSRMQEKFSKDREEFVENSEDTIHGKINVFFDQKKDIILNNKKCDRVQFDFWQFGIVNEDAKNLFTETYDTWRKHIFDTLSPFLDGINEEKLKNISAVMVSMMIGASLQYLNKPDVFDLDEYFDMCEHMILMEMRYK